MKVKMPLNCGVSKATIATIEYLKNQKMQMNVNFSNPLFALCV
jgi:hypothetical protein